MSGIPGAGNIKEKLKSLPFPVTCQLTCQEITNLNAGLICSRKVFQTIFKVPSMVEILSGSTKTPEISSCVNFLFDFNEFNF
jgi:hypothetical protein